MKMAIAPSCSRRCPMICALLILSTSKCTTSTGPESSSDVAVGGDELVLAIHQYSGFLTDPGEFFFNARRGLQAVYVYSSGKVIRTSPMRPGVDVCRGYLAYQLGQYELEDLLARIDSSLLVASEVEYRACNPVDAGASELYINWRGMRIHTSAAPCFDATDCCQAPDWGPRSPPDRLVQLVKQLLTLGARLGPEYASENGALLLGCSLPQDSAGCDFATSAADSLLTNPVFSTACNPNESTPGTVVVPADSIQALESVMKVHLSAVGGMKYPIAYALVDGHCSLFACDMILPHESDFW